MPVTHEHSPGEIRGVVAWLAALFAAGSFPHAATHKSGGADAIKLDELAAPTDVATLNSSTTAHGLLKKLSNVAAEFMNGQGNWAVPAVADGDKGDITVSGGGAAWAIDNDIVTYAKMQNVSATDKLLGRSTAGAGDVEEITCTSFARTFLDDANGAAVRTTIGAGTSSFDGAYSSLSGTPSTFAPSAHAVNHKSGGTDPIKLDELAAPTDVATLNASAAAHGLLPKLSGSASDVLKGDGTWGVGAAGGAIAVSDNALTADFTLAANKSAYIAGGLDDGGFTMDASAAGARWETG